MCKYIRRFGYLLLAVALIIASIWAWDKFNLWAVIKPIFADFTVGKYSFSLTKIFFALTAFLVLYGCTRFTQHFINRRVFPHTHLDTGVQNALSQGIAYLGITLSILVSLKLLGINLASLALVAGALSVGIGFGLQNIVSNFIAGIIVLVERPIKIGDSIMVGADRGVVKRISVRATEIEAGDGSAILVPNLQFISGSVRNWQVKTPVREFSIAVAAAYGSDTALIKELLLQIAHKHPEISAEPAPKVSFTQFGNKGLEFNLIASVKEATNSEEVSSDLRFAIEKAFKDHQIILQPCGA